MNIGSILRQKRKELKLTLKAVAEKASISEGFLSQVENDVSSPSVDTLFKICAAMEVEAGDVLNLAKQQEGLIVIRKTDWKDVELPHTGFVTRRFFPPENRKIIDSAVLVIEPGRSIPTRKNIKNSQEVLCVLKGSIELVHSNETIPLLEGDSVHYYSTPEKEMITNKSKRLSVVLWVGTI
ncbi:MAG: helix-turn-helix domain-containing protein [Desulfobacterota bacterium]|jgi:transcriptional regulator with XRE-family HTH domain|nr:helix-turn-helix domain-containing protein [Thermodesulfobacteriota bacterium]